MNTVVPPALPADDELDGLLRAFFQAQLPRSWPGPPVAASDHAASPHSRSSFWSLPLVRSRLALAASVTLLVVGSLFLTRQPGMVGDPETERNLGTTPTSASRLQFLSPDDAETPLKDRVQTSVSLEQNKDAPTAIKVEVRVLPASR